MNKEHECSCNNSYEKAKKIIEEANKNIKYCYIQGPTGSKVETGPQGIQGAKGDEVTLVITSEQETDLIFDGTTNAKLSVIKLD